MNALLGFGTGSSSDYLLFFMLAFGGVSLEAVEWLIILRLMATLCPKCFIQEPSIKFGKKYQGEEIPN